MVSPYRGNGKPLRIFLYDRKLRPIIQKRSARMRTRRRGRWLPKQPRLGARIPSVSPWRLRTFDSGISKINYYKVLENRKKFLCKRMWERSLMEKSVHNSWIFFIKSDKKKRKQIEKVTKTLDFMRVWGMLTNLRKKIKWNHRKARAKKANR